MDPALERELVERLRAADPAAFDAVHAAFNARLVNFLARLARNRDVAEDLVEETWLRLVAHAYSLRADTHLAPWLFTVARNLYVSYCRSRALDDAHAGGGFGLWPVQTIGSPFEYTAASELQHRLEAALARLPFTYREILLLVGVEGMRPAEAAVVCGISPDTARQRLKRARSMLAERLDEPRLATQALLEEVNP